MFALTSSTFWCEIFILYFSIYAFIQKKSSRVYYVREDIKCGRRDSNPHASRRQILSLVRLPITPLPQIGLLSWHKDSKLIAILQDFFDIIFKIGRAHV